MWKGLEKKKKSACGEAKCKPWDCNQRSIYGFAIIDVKMVPGTLCGKLLQLQVYGAVWPEKITYLYSTICMRETSGLGGFMGQGSHKFIPDFVSTWQWQLDNVCSTNWTCCCSTDSCDQCDNCVMYKPGLKRNNHKLLVCNSSYLLDSMSQKLFADSWYCVSPSVICPSSSVNLRANGDHHWVTRKEHHTTLHAFASMWD